jgi:hypothetical protein
MESTFEIVGPTANGTSQGTGFVVGRVRGKDSNFAYYVLVTAAHVFEEIVGQQATLLARQKQGDAWNKVPFQIRIRDSNGKPLWVRHTLADVAAMYVGFPIAAKPEGLVTTALFADDAVLDKLEVRPGDRVFILGYPLGLESPTGAFPILRAGWIASYPLVPSRTLGTFLVSFEVFPGNSGGPVFLVDYNRVYEGVTNIGVVHFIIGLVSQQATHTQQERGLYSMTVQQYPLDVAVVVPASLIADTVALLPASPLTNSGQQLHAPPP